MQGPEYTLVEYSSLVLKYSILDAMDIFCLLEYMKILQMTPTLV